MTIKEIANLGEQRDKLIALLNSRFEASVSAAQRDMLNSFMTGFVDMLQRDENGNIASNTYNQNMLTTIDQLYNNFAKKHNVLIMAALMKGVDGVLNFNNKYFSTLTEKSRLTPIKAQAVNNIKAWLGIDGDKTKTNGYLDTLINNPTVKNQIKDFSVRAVYGRKGWFALKKETEEFINGKEAGSLGAFQKYYRNYTYDLISQVDRATGETYANNLKFEFAIYEGGLMDRSRPFCKEHNGNVYHISEILKFNPPTAKQPNYNPITDLGGYGCRHHLNWIPTALALAMRPDAAKFVKNGNANPAPAQEQQKVVEKIEKETVTETQPTNPPTPERAKKIEPKTSFDEIPDLKITPFKPSDFFSKGIERIIEKQTQFNTVKKEQSELLTKYNAETAALKKHSAKFGYDEEYNKRRANLSELVKEYNAKLTRAKVLNREIEKDGEKQFAKLLENKKTESTVKLEGVVSPKQQEVFDIFKKISAGYNEGETIRVRKIKGRANFDLTTRTVNVSASDDKYVIMHEMGHSLELNNHVMKAAVDFLERRTAGKPTLKLNTLYKGFRSDEVYKDGGFFNPYVGKLYESKRISNRYYKDKIATEVISMGLEQMMRNPRLFRHQDKEHFDLIYNLFFK